MKGNGLTLVHALNGRMRLKLSRLKHDQDFALRVAHVLHLLPGVRTVTSSRLTGSLLVHYDPRMLSQQTILQTLMRILEADECRHELPRPQSAAPGIAQHSSAAGSQVLQAVTRSAAKVLLATVLPKPGGPDVTLTLGTRAGGGQTFAYSVATLVLESVLQSCLQAVLAALERRGRGHGELL